MKIPIFLLLLVFSLNVFSEKKIDIGLELNFIKNTLDEEDIPEVDLQSEAEDSTLLNEVVSSAKKKKKLLRRKLAEEEDFEFEDRDKEKEEKEDSKEKVENDSKAFKQKIDFGDVELRISRRKKEPYIEEEAEYVAEETEALSTEDKKRELAFKKKRESKDKKTKKPNTHNPPSQIKK